VEEKKNACRKLMGISEESEREIIWKN